MKKISTLELRPQSMGWGPAVRRVDLLVDGIPILDHFPIRDLIGPSATNDDEDEFLELLGKMAKAAFATRLGGGSREWQIQNLNQLLMLEKPELPDGRRRILTCPSCDCCHIACFIELADGLVAWRDFIRGNPADNTFGAQIVQNGAWKEIKCMKLSETTPWTINHGPIWFDAVAYRQVLEPLLVRLNSDG